MGRRGLAILDHWHRKAFTLDDGRILSWLVIDRAEPRLAMFSVDGLPVYWPPGHELLARHRTPRCSAHGQAIATLGL